MLEVTSYSKSTSNLGSREIDATFFLELQFFDDFRGTTSLLGGSRPGTLRVSSGRGAPVAVCRGRLLGAHPRPGRGGPGAHVSWDRPFRAEGACAGGDAGSGAARY